MKTINDLLKKTQRLAGKKKVKLQLHVPLETLRANTTLLASLGVSKVKIKGGLKAAVKKANHKAHEKKAVKKIVKSKKPSVKRKPKAAAKKPNRAKTVAKKGASQKSQFSGVTQTAVLAALRSRHNTPQAIANVMQANPVQVSKALSRYTQQGLIVRTQPGQYALKS